MAIRDPPEGSPFIFAHEFGLIICTEHRAAVFVNSIKDHLRSHSCDDRDPYEDAEWAQGLPGAIRDRGEYSERQPWKLRRPESPPLPYLPTHFGGFKCRQSDCGWVYTRSQESRIQKHCRVLHGQSSPPGSLSYHKDVCYQTFNPAFADKDGCSYAFQVTPPRAMSKQTNLSPDAAEWELSEAMDRMSDFEDTFEWEFSPDDVEREPSLDDAEWEPSETKDHIGDDRPSRRTATKAESSSPKDGAPQSRPIESHRSRHTSIDSNEPLCYPGRIKMNREHCKCRKRKREEIPVKAEESNDSNGSDDSADSDDGESTSDDEASTYGSASVSLGCEATDAEALCGDSRAEPRQHTNDEPVERLVRLQQSCAEEFTALRHELQLKLGEIAQLKEQLHRRTGELEKLLAEKVTTKNKYKKAKKSLSAAEKEHKTKEKEWANHSEDASRNTSRLQNELEKIAKIIRKHEVDLATQRTDIDNFRKQAQELEKSNQDLQGTLDERGEEIRTLQFQSQLKSREASAVAKSLEGANAALKEAQELNDSYETRISKLDQECARMGEALFERTGQVLAKVAKIGELEAELKRERARFPEGGKGSRRRVSSGQSKTSRKRQRRQRERKESSQEGKKGEGAAKPAQGEGRAAG